MVDKVKFFNRKTGQWTPWYGILVGYDGNFVYNKDTDKMNLNLVIRETQKPDLNVNDWLVVGHFDENDTTMALTFDSEGLPLNHEQYVITDPILERHPLNDYWSFGAVVKEPIESLRGKQTQTLDFSNSGDLSGVTISGIGSNLTLKGHQYNCYTALERVLKVHPINNDVFDAIPGDPNQVTGGATAVSTNGGTSWIIDGVTPAILGANFYGVVYDTIRGRLIAMPGYNASGTAYSNDGGKTWLQGGNLPDNIIWQQSIFDSRRGRAIAIAYNSTRTAVSDDGGITWQEGPSMPSASRWQAVTFDHYHDRIVAVVALPNSNPTTTSWYSPNGGQSWVQGGNVQAQIWDAAACNPSGRVIVCSSIVPNIAYSDDGGVTWQNGGPAPNNPNGYTNGWNSAAFDIVNNRFVLSSDYAMSADPSYSAYSSNGISGWQLGGNMPLTADYRGMAYDTVNNRLVAIAYNKQTTITVPGQTTPPDPDGRAWWYQFKILDQPFLQSVVFNDDTFTAADLYTILFKFDDYVDRTPVIYFDINPNTGMPRNPSKPRYLLKFERKDGFQKPEINFNTLIQNHHGIKYSNSVSGYATGIVSEVNNLTTGSVVKFPGASLWAVPEMDENIRSLSSQPNNGQFMWFLRLPFPIKRVIKIQKMRWQHNAVFINGGEQVQRRFQRDAVATIENQYILEESEYIASNYFQNTSAFHYKKGDTRLYCNDYYYSTRVAGINNLAVNAMYYVEFEPLSNTSLEYGSGEYQLAINQTDSQAETIKYTSWLDTYLRGMNNADVVIVKKYDNFNDFKNLVGSRVVDGTDEYIISQVAYQNKNLFWFVILQLNKDHYKRSLVVRANEQIRPNKAIPYDNLQDRRMRIPNNVTLFLNQQATKQDSIVVDNWGRQPVMLLLSALVPNSIPSDMIPQVALFRPRYKVTQTNGTENQYTKNFLTNFSTQVNTKQIQMNVVFENNAILATRKSHTQLTTPSSQLPLLYTDPFGKVKMFDLIFSMLDAGVFNAFPTTTWTQNWYEDAPGEMGRTSNLYSKMANLPEVSAADLTTLLDYQMMKVENVNYDKNALENFNLAVIFGVNETKDITPCQALFELSRFAIANDSHTLRIMGYSTKKQEVDLVTENRIFNITATTTFNANINGTGWIRFAFTGQNTANLKSLIVTTNDGRKLLIINNVADILGNITSGAFSIYY